VLPGAGRTCGPGAVKDEARVKGPAQRTGTDRTAGNVVTAPTAMAVSVSSTRPTRGIADGFERPEDHRDNDAPLLVPPPLDTSSMCSGSGTVRLTQGPGDQLFYDCGVQAPQKGITAHRTFWMQSAPIRLPIAAVCIQNEAAISSVTTRAATRVQRLTWARTTRRRSRCTTRCPAGSGDR